MLIKKKPPALSVLRQTAGKRRVGKSWPAASAKSQPFSPWRGGAGICSSHDDPDRLRHYAIRTASEKLGIRLQARRLPTRGHVFECAPSSVRHADPADIDQLGSGVDDLMSYRYQPSLSEKEKHPICETEVCFGAALLVDEHL
jgi:hypothetical protein